MADEFSECESSDPESEVTEVGTSNNKSKVEVGGDEVRDKDEEREDENSEDEKAEVSEKDEIIVITDDVVGEKGKKVITDEVVGEKGKKKRRNK